MSDSEDEESVWRLIAADEELRLSRIAAAPAAPAAAQLVVRAAAPAAPAAAQGDHWGGADSTVDSVASWRALGHHLCLPWALPVFTPAGGALTLKTKLFLALFAAYRTCRVTYGSGAAAAGAERGGGEQQGQGRLHVLSLRYTD